MSDAPEIALPTIIGGIVGAFVLTLMARFWNKAALILADIGDSITETNAKSRESSD